MKPAVDSRCLQFDPFGSDDFDTKVFRDRIVVVRRNHECYWCGGPVSKGQLARARTEAFEGMVKTFRWCWQCCGAMATAGDDAMQQWSNRMNMFRTVLK